MKLLAIETATEACSVAVWVDGDLRERHEIAPRRHAELVLPWADALLAEAGLAKAQLDAIAVGRGPGAFTGVRLAIAVAQGIALALDVPVVPVSTLAALAMQGGGDEVLAAIDARMGEVYLGAFSRGSEGLVVPAGAERLAKPGEVDAEALVATPSPAGVSRWFGVGTGFAAEGGLLAHRLGLQPSRIDATALPRAAHVARLAANVFAHGGAVAPELAEPAYLRDKVALTLDEQRAAKGS